VTPVGSLTKWRPCVGDQPSQPFKAERVAGTLAVLPGDAGVVSRGIIKAEPLRKVLGGVTTDVYSSCDASERSTVLEVADEVWRHSDKESIRWMDQRDGLARVVIAAIAVEVGEICAWQDTDPSRNPTALQDVPGIPGEELVRLPPSETLSALYRRFALERNRVQESLHDYQRNREASNRVYRSQFRFAYWLSGGFARYVELAYGLSPLLSFARHASESASRVLDSIVEYGEEIRAATPTLGWLDVVREFAIMAAAYECQQRHRARWHSGWFTESDVAFHHGLGLKLGTLDNPFLPAAGWAAERAHFEQTYFRSARERVRADTDLELSVFEVRNAYKTQPFRRWPKAEFDERDAHLGV
jgi:hypothetical protein